MYVVLVIPGCRIFIEEATGLPHNIKFNRCKDFTK